LDLAISARGVKKIYRSGLFKKRQKAALTGIDLSIPKGAFWGILGPNGAGKTTLLSVLSTLLLPDAGEVSILGMDVRTRSHEICERINLSSGHANFFWSMSILQNLNYFAMLYGLAGKARKRKIEELLDLFDLKEFARIRFDELSTGTKQKLSLSKALLNDPEILLLDEPSVGLDPDVALRIREFIASLHREKGTTILLTTHNMKEAEQLCEQIAFIKEGAIKALGRPKELKNLLKLGDTIDIEFQGNLAESAILGLEGVYDLSIRNSSCRITVDDQHERLPGILKSFINQNIHIHDIQIQEADLEDVFMAYSK
jgi:ABC-2 type transport system ATP-binding protein